MSTFEDLGSKIDEAIKFIKNKCAAMLEDAERFIRAKLHMGLPSEEIEHILQEQIKNQLNQIDALNKQVEEKFGIILKQDKIIDILQEELTVKENEAGRLDKENKLLKQCINGLCDRMNEIIRENNILKNQNTELKAEINRKNDTLYRYINMTEGENRLVNFIKSLGYLRIASQKYDMLCTSNIDTCNNSGYFKNAKVRVEEGYYGDIEEDEDGSIEYMQDWEYETIANLKKYIDILYDIKVEYSNDVYSVNVITGEKKRDLIVNYANTWGLFPFEIENKELDKARIKANIMTGIYGNANWIYDGYEQLNLIGERFNGIRWSDYRGIGYFINKPDY